MTLKPWMRAVAVSVLAIISNHVADCAWAQPPPVRHYCIEEPYKYLYPVAGHCDTRLGLPLEEATAVLTDSERRLLDGVRRIVHEAGLMSRRAEVIRALGAEVDQTITVPGRLPNSPPRMRSDLFRGIGEYSPAKEYRSYFAYSRPVGTEPGDSYKWFARVRIEFDRRRKCISSRAGEGYLDIPLSTQVRGMADVTHPPTEWNRHEFSNTAIAERISVRHPRLTIDIVDGCISNIILHGDFDSKEVSDAPIHD